MLKKMKNLIAATEDIYSFFVNILNAYTSKCFEHYLIAEPKIDNTYWFSIFCHVNVKFL